MTGRKIIVDSYGGWGAHGGGAFSGKDFSKVDRSAAYAARWVAKSLVAAGLCKRVLVQVAYAIGIAHPLSLNVEDYGTGKVSKAELLAIINKNFDLRPGVIVRWVAPSRRRSCLQRVELAPAHLPGYGRVRTLWPRSVLVGAPQGMYRSRATISNVCQTLQL